MSQKNTQYPHRLFVINQSNDWIRNSGYATLARPTECPTNGPEPYMRKRNTLANVQNKTTAVYNIHCSTFVKTTRKLAMTTIDQSNNNTKRSFVKNYKYVWPVYLLRQSNKLIWPLSGTSSFVKWHSAVHELFVYNGDAFVWVSEFNLLKCSRLLNSFELLGNRKNLHLSLRLLCLQSAAKQKPSLPM